jgi:hypothetical protein
MTSREFLSECFCNSFSDPLARAGDDDVHDVEVSPATRRPEEAKLP